jgi:hypothetical protein
VRQIRCLNVVLVVFAFNKSGVQAFSLKKIEIVDSVQHITKLYWKKSVTDQ